MKSVPDCRHTSASAARDRDLNKNCRESTNTFNLGNKKIGLMRGQENSQSLEHPALHSCWLLQLGLAGNTKQLFYELTALDGLLSENQQNAKHDHMSSPKLAWSLFSSSLSTSRYFRSIFLFSKSQSSSWESLSSFSIRFDVSIQAQSFSFWFSDARSPLSSSSLSLALRQDAISCFKSSISFWWSAFILETNSIIRSFYNLKSSSCCLKSSLSISTSRFWVWASLICCFSQISRRQLRSSLAARSFTPWVSSNFVNSSTLLSSWAIQISRQLLLLDWAMLCPLWYFESTDCYVFSLLFFLVFNVDLFSLSLSYN